MSKGSFTSKEKATFSDEALVSQGLLIFSTEIIEGFLAGEKDTHPTAINFMGLFGRRGRDRTGKPIGFVVRGWLACHQACNGRSAFYRQSLTLL